MLKNSRTGQIRESADSVSKRPFIRKDLGYLPLFNTLNSDLAQYLLQNTFTLIHDLELTNRNAVSYFLTKSEV